MPALCILPTPLAASRAARRLCDAQGGILFGPAVSTLGRLVPGLLAAAGDRRAVLSPLAERLLAIRAGADAGGPFARLAPADGLAGALAGALAELRRGEVEPGDLRAAAAGLDPAPRARLEALAAALDAYRARLGGLEALDRTGALRAAAEAASRGAASPETAGLELLVVDGLVAAAPAEWDLLAALVARARRTRVHLAYFPDRPDLSAPAEPLLRRLEALHELSARRDVEVVLPRLEGDGRAARPAALLAAFGGGRGAPPGGAAEGQVLAVAGAGTSGEAEAAAAAIAGLLEAGHSPEDVALISPTPGRAAAGLARALAARGIALDAGRGPPLLEAPVVRAVREALSAAGDLSRSAAERLLGSAWLAPRGAPPGAWLDRAGALDGRGPPAEALRRRAAALRGGVAARERAALGRAAEAVEGLEASLRPLASPGTAREHAVRLSAFLDRAGIRRRAARGEAAEAARDLAALQGIEEAAEAVVHAAALLGEAGAPLGAEAFRARLDLALERATLPPAASAAGAAVELWGSTDAPGLSARAAVITGCVRGAFPAPPPPEPVLREPERLALNRHLRRAAVSTAAGRRAEALHRAFAAAAAGREAIAFVWAAPGPGGGGGPLAPRVAEALAAVGVAPPAAPAPEPGLADARTPRAALRAAARLGATGAAALRDAGLAPRAEDALARGAIEAERRAAVQAREASPHAGRIDGPALPALRAALPAEWAPTELEAYARCPFRALLARVLRLPERSASDLDADPRDEGSLLHAVLERFVARRMARHAWPPDGGAGDVTEVRAVAAEVFARFEGEGRTGDPSAWAARREAVLGRLDRVVRAEARDHDGLVPAAVELRFGSDAAHPALPLSAGGETVLLKGRIDRVDASTDRLLVVDYKNARSGGAHAGELAPEALGVTSFQVPTYLLAAARALPGRTRLEATFALLRKAARLPPLSLEAGDPLLATEVPAGEQGPPSPGLSPRLGGGRGGETSHASASGEAPHASASGEAPHASASGEAPHASVSEGALHATAGAEAPHASAGEGALHATAGAEAPHAPRPFAAAVVETVRRIRSGAFPLMSRSCDGCPYGAVCRAQGLADLGDGEAAGGAEVAT